MNKAFKDRTLDFESFHKTDIELAIVAHELYVLYGIEEAKKVRNDCIEYMIYRIPELEMIKIIQKHGDKLGLDYDVNGTKMVILGSKI